MICLKSVELFKFVGFIIIFLIFMNLILSCAFFICSEDKAHLRYKWRSFLEGGKGKRKRKSEILTHLFL